MTKQRKSPHPQLDAFTRKVLAYRPSKDGGKPKGREAPDGTHRPAGATPR